MTEKLEALKKLVANAVEGRKHDPVADPFNGKFHPNHSLDILLDVLQTSDALDVLNDVLNKKENN